MYKIILSDMDETFLGSDHTIPPTNLQALEMMRQKGVLFVPCSGRPYRSIMDNFKEVDSALMQDSYVVSLNGGFINRFGDPTPLTEVTLHPEAAQQLYAYGVQHRICMHINVASGLIYTQFAYPEERRYLEGLNGIVTLPDTQRDLSFTSHDPVVKILFVHHDLDALYALGDRIAPLLDPRHVEITYSSGRYLELMPAGINKGVGLRTLCSMLDIDVAESIAVGDARNDLEMIQAAGLGVGVANVTPEVADSCDVILKTRGQDGAFMELVELFL